MSIFILNSKDLSTRNDLIWKEKMHKVNLFNTCLNSNSDEKATGLKLKGMLLIIIICIFSFFTSNRYLAACTSFVLKKGDNILLCKNLDWPVGDGFVFINKRGEIKSSVMMDENSFSWESKYGSITFNQFGKNLPLGGINEKGLVVEELSYNLSCYPPVTENTLNEFEWVQYQLDNFQNVEEVIINLDSISILPLIAKLHYIICDCRGKTAIIEFIDGKVKYYTGDSLPIPVLTNNCYDNLIQYSRHFINFGGDKTVTNGPESPERFIRAATLLKKNQQINPANILESAFSILNAVDQEDTQWSISYDIRTKNIYFKTKWINTVHKIELSGFDFKETKILNLHTIKPDRQVHFHDFKREENCNLIENVLRQLIDLDELSKWDAERIIGILYMD